MFIAIINSSVLRPDTLTVEFTNENVRLPVWRDDNNCIFFSIQDAHARFGLNFKIVDRSEWLAIFFIPHEMISMRHMF